MAQLGGSSFVISPGQGTWELETRVGRGDGRRRRGARARGDPGARAVLRRARRPELRGGQGPRRGPGRLGHAHHGGALSGPVREPRVRDHPPVPVARRLEDAGRPRRPGAPGTVRSLVGVAPEAAAVRGAVLDAAAWRRSGGWTSSSCARRATSCRTRSWSAPPRSRARRGGTVSRVRGDARRGGRRPRALRQVVVRSLALRTPGRGGRDAPPAPRLVRARVLVRGRRCRAPGSCTACRSAAT